MVARFMTRCRRRVNTEATPPMRLDWMRLSEWLTEMEERVPDGVYLEICTLLKHLYSANTLEAQRFYIREIWAFDGTQWSYHLQDPLAC